MNKTVFSFQPDPNTHYDLATEYFYDGNFLHALREINEAIRLDPACLEYRFLQADIYYDMGMYAQSLVSALRVLAFDTSVHECHGLAARALCAMDNTAAAMFYFNLGMRYGLADGTVTVEELREALTPPDRFVLVDDDEINATALDAARSAYVVQDYERAYALAAEVDGGSTYAVMAALMQADCAMARHNSDAAVEVLNRAYAKTESLAVKATLSHVYFVKGRYTEASDVFCAPASCTVKDAEEAIRVAQVLVDRDEFADAIRFYEKALEFLPYDLDVMTGIAMCESQRGNFEASSRWLMDVLAIDPLDYVAMKHNERVQDHLAISKENYLDISLQEVQSMRETIRSWRKLPRYKLGSVARRTYYVAMLFYALDRNVLSENESKDILRHLLASDRFELVLREMLVDYAMGLTGKRLMCTVLAEAGCDYLEVEHEDVIWYVDLKLPSKFKTMESDLLLKAWSLAVGTLSYASVDFGKELRFAFNKICEVELPQSVEPEHIASAVISILLVNRKIELRGQEVVEHLFDGISKDFGVIESLAALLDPLIMAKRRKNEEERSAVKRKTKGEHHEI